MYRMCQLYLCDTQSWLCAYRLPLSLCWADTPLHLKMSNPISESVIVPFSSNVSCRQTHKRFHARFIACLLAFSSTLCVNLPLAHPATTVSPASADVSVDVVIYGNTSAAVIAAVQVKQMGKSVVIVGPDKHLGGLSAGGLGWTDSGSKSAIGGLSRNFYHRVWKHYQQDSAWPWQKKAKFGARHQNSSGKEGGGATMWVFEPSIAEAVFEELIAEYSIPVYREEFLNRRPRPATQADNTISHGVEMQNGNITAIHMLSGKTFRGQMFLDTTYEGDLMACAGISYHVGREANSVYGETWNGIQTGTLHHKHHFQKPVSPYKIAGDPSSSVLPLVSTDPPGTKGEGDHRIQAYCFRMCLTDHAPNRMPFPKPDGYDADQYQMLSRVFNSGWREHFGKFDRIQNHKTDTNNHGPVSTDYIGMNYDYPEASYERRAEIVAEHERYQKGLMYFTANHPSVPADVRKAMSKWGLPKDEFQDNGGWPHQIYVREARRMIGDYVMTEHDCLDAKDTPDSIGMGSYTLDSHNVQRYIKPDGMVQNEGDIGVKTPAPYEVAYGSIVPKKSECKNLLVPVCVSSSHMAFGSLRMEPVFMILGQSAATAACLSIDQNMAVQDLKYESLKQRLIQDKQVLKYNKGIRFRASKLKGVVVDDNRAILHGSWSMSNANTPFVGSGYRHSGGSKSEPRSKSAEFKATLKPGRYEVRMYWPTNKNRASNVPVTIQHQSGSADLVVNQKSRPIQSPDALSLGTFDFGSTGSIIVKCEGTDGYVVLDAVQFVPVNP
ncbi:MAG: FAD-dependent oxidoreductase [Fuerstiella sp.]